MVARVKNRTEYTYRCQVCGFECVKTKMPQSDVPVTKRGNYGSNAVPTPASFTTDAIYTARTIAFVDAAGDDPAKLTDSAYRFADNHIRGNMTIVIVTDSGTNDGTYTIANRGVSRGEILLSDDDSLTDETAADAGEVSIKVKIYKPNVTTGCPFCGSLNSIGD